MLSSCGDMNNNDTSDSDLNKIDEDLIGTWSTCFEDGTSGKSFKIEYIFDESYQKYNNITYLDNSCNDEIYRILYNRKYEIFSTTNTSFNEINFTTSDVKIIYLKQSGEFSVDTLNSTNAYGFNDWQINVEKDITGLSPDAESEPIPQKGETLYQIYQIIDNKLMIGDPRTGNSSTEEERPTEVNKDLILSKNI